MSTTNLRKSLQEEKMVLKHLVKRWTPRVQQFSGNNRLAGAIRSAIGMALLLLNKKMKHYQNLISRYDLGEMCVSNEFSLNDLEALFDVIYIQVEDIKSTFRRLDDELIEMPKNFGRVQRPHTSFESKSTTIPEKAAFNSKTRHDSRKPSETAGSSSSRDPLQSRTFPHKNNTDKGKDQLLCGNHRYSAGRSSEQFSIFRPRSGIESREDSTSSHNFPNAQEEGQRKVKQSSDMRRPRSRSRSNARAGAMLKDVYGIGSGATTHRPLERDNFHRRLYDHSEAENTPTHGPSAATMKRRAREQNAKQSKKNFINNVTYNPTLFTKNLYKSNFN